MEVLVVLLVCTVLYLILYGRRTLHAQLAASRIVSRRHCLGAFARGLRANLSLAPVPQPSLQVEAHYRGHAVRVYETIPDETAPHVLLHLRMRVIPQATHPLEVIIAPVSLRSALDGAEALEELATGDEDFARRYCVRTNDRGLARTFLHAQARRSVAALGARAADGDVTVSIGWGDVHVRLRTFPLPAFLLKQVYRIVLRLFDRAIEVLESPSSLPDVERRPTRLVPPGPAAEIPLLAEDPGQTAGPVCQVCGDVIGGDAVCCTKCHTPHHLDCWTFAGQCSTYGCQCPSAKPWRPAPRDEPSADEDGRGGAP